MRTSFMQLFHHLRSDVGVMEAHLPSLRRYAEAMSGNRETADAQLAAMMDQVAADITVLPAASSAKVGLLKLYTRLHVGTQSAQARMRQIVLLVVMEGFSKKETAEILDVAMAEVVTILKSAGGTMAAFTGTDAIGNGGKDRPSYRPLHTSSRDRGQGACRGKGRIDRHVQ